MTQPTPFTRAYGATVFTDESTNTPTVPHTGVKMDGELNNVLTTLTQVLVNLALIQRDDGQVANATIGVDQLKTELQAGLNEPSAWVTATAYSERDSVINASKFYKCIVAHTSGTFATDLAAADWVLLIDFTALSQTAIDAAFAASLAAAIASINAAGATQLALVQAAAADVISQGILANEIFG